MTVTSPDFDAHDMDDVPPRWWNRHIRTRTQVTEIAVMFGALSIVSFWAAGLGIAAGLIAIASALWADRSPDLSGPLRLHQPRGWEGIGRAVRPPS